MTGMFQSSRMASGIIALQAAQASSAVLGFARKTKPSDCTMRARHLPDHPGIIDDEHLREHAPRAAEPVSVTSMVIARAHARRHSLPPNVKIQSRSRIGRISRSSRCTDSIGDAFRTEVRRGVDQRAGCRA